MLRLMKHSILSALILLVFGFASFANAEVVEYVYDFDNLSTGNLLNQDGWYNPGSDAYDSTNYIEVKSDATSPMSGNYLYKVGDDYTKNIYLSRTNDEKWSFSITEDTYWEMSTLVQVGPGSNGPEGLFSIEQVIDGVRTGAKGFWVGSRGTGSTNAQYRLAGTIYSYAIDSEDWGIIEVGLSATPTGVTNTYDIDLWYETTPGDVSTKVILDTKTGIVADMSTYNSMTANMKCYGLSYLAAMVDDYTIRVGEVPEPSTLALLTASLIGLLAYAWRKRK